MNDIPTNRSEWAKLDWQSAQHLVGRMLNHAGFTILEELNLGKKRADIMVSKTEGEISTIGIIEVKCYQRIGKSMQEKALIQACRYMTSLYNLQSSNHRWNSKEKEYFIAAVYTNDYPTIPLDLNPVQRELHLPTEIRDITIINSSVDSLLYSMRKSKLIQNQTTLDDFL